MDFKQSNVVAPSTENSVPRWRYGNLTIISMFARPNCIFILWCCISLNSILDPLKTLWGYYLYKDFLGHEKNWQLSTFNTFNNQTSKACNSSETLLDCYYELPVYGSGSLAGSKCRSYYAIDFGNSQHITAYFGNCTLTSGQQLFLPDNANFATTQWGIQTSSTQQECLSWLGEGDAFPCDSYTTYSGDIVNYRISRTETKKWCKEFGAYYILNKSSNQQQILMANVTDLAYPSFTSIPLDFDTPVMYLNDRNCSYNLHVGGTPAHVSTSAWYGNTIAIWIAYSTGSAKSNTITAIGDLYRVHTEISLQGDMILIRSITKDVCRCILLSLVVYYRVSSIYYPIWLVYHRQNKTLWTWAKQNYMGLVIHKRERHNLFILFLLCFEAIMSIEDIVMYCQHTIYTTTSAYTALLMDYMSITRIIWPCAFLSLCFSRILQLLFGRNYALVLSEDLFLLGAPVVWFYIPIYVTTQGMSLFQGYRWTGRYVHHFTTTIVNVYTHSCGVLDLYIQLFGYFTILSCIVTIVVGAIWQRHTNTKSITEWMFGSQRISYCSPKLKKNHTPLERVLLECSDDLPPAIVYQITKAKLSSTDLSGSMNLAAEGLVMMVHGNRNILAIMKWGTAYPIRNYLGHIACIRDNIVEYESSLSIEVLAKFKSRPVLLGVPDLY